MKKLILTLIISIMFAACSSNYEAKTSTGGYSSEKIGQDEYMVTFRGNSHTSLQMARDYGKLRVAEICLESTQPFFEILKFKQIYTSNALFNDKPVSFYHVKCLDTDKDKIFAKNAIDTYKRITTIYELKDSK